MKKIIISLCETQCLTEVIAGLTRENLAFTCTLVGSVWEIEITGY